MSEEMGSRSCFENDLYHSGVTASSVADLPISKILAENVGFLKSFSNDSAEIQAIAQAGAYYKVQDGQFYIVEGQTHIDRFNVLIQGSVKVQKNESDAGEMHSGDFFGQFALVGDPRPADFSVVPVTDAIFFTLAQSEFQSILSKFPELSMQVLRNALAEMDNHESQGWKASATIKSGRAAPRSGAGARVVVFDAKPYERIPLEKMSQGTGYEMVYVKETLSPKTAHLAKGADVVCLFVHDQVSADVLKALGPKPPLFTLRNAGFELVDVPACDSSQVSVTRVPSYSPNAISEHAVSLMMSLNRHIVQAHARVSQADFSLDGLVGFNMLGKTVGVIGTGKIGYYTVQILRGFGCNVICYDVFKNPQLLEQGIQYVELDELFARSTIISLHAPLLPSTKHMINAKSLEKCKDGVMIINTSRGGLIDTSALVDGIISGKVGACGLDVVENEGAYFYRDLSDQVIKDDHIARLIGFNNVILTSHQAYLTKEALEEIATTTMKNIHEYIHEGKRMKSLTNSVNTAEFQA